MINDEVAVDQRSNDAAPGPSGPTGRDAAPSQLAATRRTRRCSRRRGKASRSASWDDHTATQHSSSPYDAVVQAPRHKSRPREHPQSPNILAFRMIGPPKKLQNEPVRSSLASWLGAARGFGRCIKKIRPARGPPRECLGTTAAPWATGMLILSDPHIYDCFCVPVSLRLQPGAPPRGSAARSQRETAGTSNQRRRHRADKTRNPFPKAALHARLLCFPWHGLSRQLGGVRSGSAHWGASRPSHALAPAPTQLM